MMRWFESPRRDKRKKKSPAMLAQPVEPRDLTLRERDLLSLLLDHASFDGARELAEQVARTRVAGGFPTLLDLDVPKTAPASRYKPRLIPLRALVHSPGGELLGEILVWVRDGYLSALEYAWYADDAPSEMPPLDNLRVEEYRPEAPPRGV
jgi:hypothetical protein